MKTFTRICVRGRPQALGCCTFYQNTAKGPCRNMRLHSRHEEMY
jgi:hypothetical protein